MTKAEEAFAWYLKREEMEGNIAAWYFESITLQLAKGRGHGGRPVKYTPDFLIALRDGTFRIVEIKGPYIREDSVIKFKMAADLFPDFEWQMIQIRKDGTAKVLRHIPARDVQKFCAPDGSSSEIEQPRIQGKSDD